MARSSAFLLFIIVFFLPRHLFAQHAQPDSHYRLLAGNNYVSSKNYYLLTLFQEVKEVRDLLSSDAVLGAMGAKKIDSLTMALASCGKDGECYTRSLKFSDAEISTVSERLKALYSPGNALDKLVKNHLIPSGTYILFQDLSPAEMLVRAWEQDAEGVNYVIGVYGEGKKPNYPAIDSISYDLHDPRKQNAYATFLYDATAVVIAENKPASGFFSPSLTAALGFLEMNERERAADYEPMRDGENKAAVDQISKIRWASYKYSVIMIPGAGPDEPGVSLSAEGMLRCRLAAIQYRKGLAPFIVPSGGKVHPYKTPYCEAIEMKKFLVEKLHIPAAAVIIEPHARHTTTNMRNTVRLIYRYGIPFDMPAISCTTKGQSSLIENTQAARCQRELNEVPFKNGKRLSETELEFYPLIEGLQINPKEPMDP